MKQESGRQEYYTGRQVIVNLLVISMVSDTRTSDVYSYVYLKYSAGMHIQQFHRMERIVNLL